MTEIIADLPLDDRPRERLLTHGASALSDAELLAILLGSGTRGKNAIQLARELLSDGLPGLRRRETPQISRVRGVGSAKAARIAAAFELSKRLEDCIDTEPVAFHTERFARALITTYGHSMQERLGAAFLDSRRRILKQREIYVGTINQALVSTRDIVRCALDENAVAVVLFHNHPSGTPTPSGDDLLFTRKISEALNLVDIELIDHIIVGGNRWQSVPL